MGFIIVTLPAISQDSLAVIEDDYIGDEEDSKSAFTFGLHIGTLIANQHTASMYDGYGFDIDGNKNTWASSLMNQKINNEYGGRISGQPVDRIAEELNVDPYTWIFDESDMPTNMRYTVAFAVGLSASYSVDNSNAILLNVNAAQLAITGNFTITTPQTNSASATQINKNINTFAIVGGEQRLILQLAYQHIFGGGEKFGALVEGGLHATLAKYDKNIININNLTIDLTEYYNNVNSFALPVRKPTGMGFGAFGSVGVNANMSPQATIQLIYSPAFVKVNMGLDRQYKLQHGIGLRLFYDIFGSGDNEKESNMPDTEAEF